MPETKRSKWASENGYLDILKWLAELPQAVLPNTDMGANLACLNGHLDILKWLAKKEILPDESGAN